MKRFLLAASFAAATVPACSPAVACYSDGYRTGVIQKLSKRGLITKSYEGELVMSGLKFRMEGGGGNVWRFSARSSAIGDLLEQAMLSQQPVTVKYCQELISVTTDTKYIITDVTQK